MLGVISALAPIYYFQGKENLKLVGVVETLAGLATVLAVYFAVKGSADFYLLPVILLLVRGMASAVMTAWMMRHVGLRMVDSLDLQMGKKTLVSAFNLFVFQGAVGFYTSFNVVFLGFLLTGTSGHLCCRRTVDARRSWLHRTILQCYLPAT